MMNDYKMENGVRILLTDDEQTQHDAMGAAWTAGAKEREEKAAIPDLVVQLTAALIAKGTISADDLHPETIDDINVKLENAGIAKISAIEK